jgi:MFS family permease
VGARGLLAVRDARVFLAGQAVSGFGDSALWLAAGIWIKELTGSSGAAGFAFFFFFAPTLAAPVCGVLVDRLDRRRLLILVNGLTACAVLLLLLVRSAAELWLIYAVMALYGLSNCTLSATQSALLTEILPPRLLADANAALRTISATLSLVAPLLGAGLFAWAGPRVLVIFDALTFLVPMLCAARLRRAAPAARRRATGWGVELTAGRATSPPARCCVR